MFTQVKQVMAITVVFVVLACLPISATIINVPDDYSTIQAGIDASSDGDTVLVAMEHYFERINFYGKGILLTSEFMLDDDTLHIQNTIIDADTSVLGVADTGSVVCFVNDEDSTSVIQGFTIQNGIGTISSYIYRWGGGIHCYLSSPTISNNIIAGNYAEDGGGIFWINNSSPTIKNNTITENSTDNSGGGIYCGSSSTSTINNNTITGNSAYKGGGIYCYNSNPTISNNTIAGNSTQMRGGGIYCYNSNPIISDNAITGNSTYEGGGIHCYESSPTISNNIINGNSADYWGGGIYCFESSPTISNNTINGNSAAWGGGIYCHYSDPIVVNTILWANMAEAGGNEIYLNYGSSISITYSDIQGGWNGEGNIDADPLFVDPENGDYYLQAGSPCIDTGDPDSPLDPDSTRADIGAFYFDQSTSIEESYILPMQFSLSQNYPNPFNPTTTISFAIEHAQFVTLKVYDLLGREVRALIDEDRQAGLHNIIFDASDLSSGIYFYRLQAGDMSESKRMGWLK